MSEWAIPSSTPLSLCFPRLSSVPTPSPYMCVCPRVLRPPDEPSDCCSSKYLHPPKAEPSKHLASNGPPPTWETCKVYSVLVDTSDVLGFLARPISRKTRVSTPPEPCSLQENEWSIQLVAACRPTATGHKRGAVPHDRGASLVCYTRWLAALRVNARTGPFHPSMWLQAIASYPAGFSWNQGLQGFVFSPSSLHAPVIILEDESPKILEIRIRLLRVHASTRTK